jgi:hypothetical protein
MNNEYFYVEKNNLISNYLIDKFKLWVWDFDDTLIDTTTYYKKSMEPEDILNRTNEELDIDIPNWRYFKSCVNYLVSRGIRVSIASFGTYKIIKAYMDRLFGINQRIFTDVNLKALCRGADGKPVKFYPNKNDFIEKIMIFYKIYEPIKVILFDDNMTNISDAMGSGIVGVKIIGKDNNEIANRSMQYSSNTYKTYFGEYVVDRLEKTLKRLEKEGKLKENCFENNLKNETFSAVGSRKIGTINKAKRLEREQFFKSIKEEYDKEQESINENGESTNESFKNIPYKVNNKLQYKYPQTNKSILNEIRNNIDKKSNIKTKTNNKKEYFNINNNHSYRNLNTNYINKQTLIILIILICLIVLILIKKNH